MKTNNVQSQTKNDIQMLDTLSKIILKLINSLDDSPQAPGMPIKSKTQAYVIEAEPLIEQLEKKINH